ncbi:MAG: hypothetical protein ABI488_25040 [Polyangiaceae bacterium]
MLLGTSGCFGGVDECDRGATRCNAGNPETCEEDCSDFGCHNKWQVGDFCTAAQSCIAPNDTAPMCAESPSKDPLCAGAEKATYCSGQQLVQCQHGYRAITRACGSVDDFGYEQLPGGSASTMCVDPGDGNATCIPEAAKVDSLCDGITGPRCDGTTLVECVDQHAVFKTACASCTTQTTPACDTCPPTTRGLCRGYLGDSCALDEDCAPGLLCHDNGIGLRACSLACSVEAASAPDAGVAPAGASNAQCYAAFNADETPISSYSEVKPAGRLSCIAGYCKWAP